MRKEVRELLENEIVTTAEAALRTNIPEVTIRKRILSGTLEAVKKGKTWLVDITDLKRRRKK